MHQCICHASSSWAQYRLQFLSNHFQTSHISCWWWEEVSLVMVKGSKFNVKFGALSVRSWKHNTDYGFAESLSKITHKFWAMRGGTLLILSHEVKGQGQIWSSVNNTLYVRNRLQFCSMTFKFYTYVVDYRRRNPIDFWSNFMVKFCTLTIKTLVGTNMNTVLVKLHSNSISKLIWRRILLILSHGVKGQGHL